MLLNNKREDPKMRKTYQKPYIDILYVDIESPLASGSGDSEDIGETDREAEGSGPSGGVSNNISGDLDGAATAKGGSLWDDWE